MTVRARFGAALAFLFAILAGPAAAQRATPSGAPLSRGQRAELSVLRWFYSTQLPANDQFTSGARTIDSAATLAGPIAIANGDLVVNGTINGDAIVVGGDIILRPSGHITGNATTIGGNTQALGGRVDGEIRTLYSIGRGRVVTTPTRPLTTMEMIRLVIGWFAVLAIIGVGVLMFAERNMDGVVIAIERGFGRAFLWGIVGQLAILPTLFLLCLGLVLTIVGVLLVPFAIVAYFIALAGVLTLGFLAVARLTGMVVARRGPVASPRGEALRGLSVGLPLFMAIWLIAAATTSAPVVGTIFRLVAVCVTWVAATLGLGAAIVSRAGTDRAVGRAARKPVADELAWQTPTPVTGVAAARRPVARKEA